MSNACVIIIGNEVLSGRTKDANLSFLGERLNEIGVRLLEARVIADDTDTIIENVNDCRARFDYVFTTGGIGPTHDDITSDAIAKAFGLPLIRNPEALALLQQHYSNPEDLNEQRLKMCETPEGATLIDNPISKAPGYQIGNVFVLAGVPVVMRAMFESLKHRLVGGLPMLSITIVAYIGEGVLAGGLGVVQEAHAAVEIGSYPFFREGALGSALVLRGTDQAGLEAAAEAVREMVRGLGVEPFEEQ
ncbi:MAG: competence/damage-inducible protein A [Rhodospirillaceae bacterium]|jgi:molybdenum cofactor synthesis domain-containing protein|nr:competence/damage-inducible protein A [Rhodospirillaceae bacterium]MBT5563533.1 competence/damage-inducible protein A [Rhodospirillaceae bacterium]MBT7137742.1 competence/damage-inducible protein A [Rhodospirillaceae bacterium]